MRPTRIALTALVTLALAAPAEAAPPAAAPSPASATGASAASAAATGASASRGPATGASASPGFESSASCVAPGSPLFGITRIDGRRTLARFGPRTLRPLRAPRVEVPLRTVAAHSAISPGCDAVALRVLRGRIVLVDLRLGRRTASLTLAGRAAVGRLAWPRPDRLTGFTGPYLSQRVVTVSVPDGRVVAVHRLGGRPWTSQATSLGMVMLAGRADRVGPVTLALATPDGGMLRAPLSRIRAGYHDDGPRAPARQVTPGLAVDEAAGRAYVVAATEPLVAEVDLSSGAVTYHELRRGAGAAGPSGGAASPVPRAADRVPSGPFRIAHWVGDGTIAVAGGDVRPKRNWRRLASKGLPSTTIVPDGLRLVRTADWSATTLDPLISRFAPSGGALVGMRPLEGVSPAAARGLAVYGPDGRRRVVRVRESRGNALQGAAWPYAYVTARDRTRTHVVDLRTGRTASTLPARRPPALLLPWTGLSAG